MLVGSGGVGFVMRRRKYEVTTCIGFAESL